MIRLYQLVIWLHLVLAVPSALAAEPLRVVTSIKPIHSLVAGIMLGVGEPELLMDASVAPWDFQPDHSQQSAVTNADLVIWSGPELETLLAEVLKQHPGKARYFEVLASESLKILPARANNSQRDPFFWLDSRNMLLLLDELTNLLLQLDPENSDSYERNRVRMLKEIVLIDRKLEFGYREVSDIPVFLYHDTHQYFEQAYAMRKAGNVVSPPANPVNVAAGILSLKAWLTEKLPGHCLFTEKSLQEPHLEFLLAGSDIKPVELDSFGADLPAGVNLYITLMERNFEAIANCVSKLKSDKSTGLEVQKNTPDTINFPHQIIPRYLLMNQYGQMISNQDFPGRFQLIYFGYTFCPDICPTSLGVISGMMALLEESADQVQPIFISVDPDRDTLEVLKQYTAYFHPRMMGLTGTKEVIKQTAERFKARYEKVPSLSGDPTRYSMDHNSSLYLLGRDGEFITKFPYGMSAVEISNKLRELISQ